MKSDASRPANMMQIGFDDLVKINETTCSYLRTGRIWDAVFYLARAADGYSERGQDLKAIAVLKKAATIAPDNVVVSKRLAKLYLRCGMKASAIRECIRAALVYYQMEQADRAIRACRKITSFDRDNPSARMALAEICAREGLIDEAKESFIAAASLFEKEGESEKAMKACLRALSLRPEESEPLKAIA